MSWPVIRCGISCILLLLILNEVNILEKEVDDAYFASIYLSPSYSPASFI